MKTTYLAFNEINNPNSGLKVITQKEWDDILKKNRTLPRDERRYFTKDSIGEGYDRDDMYIETTREEYNKWHVENEMKRRNDVAKRDYTFVSLSEPVYKNNDDLPYEEIISDGCDMEEMSIDNMLFKELRVALAEWHDWAEELLDYSLAGEFRTCTGKIMSKYGISYPAVKKRKDAFKEFVSNFYGLQVKF